MLLFIDRLPLFRKTYRQGAEIFESWHPLLPMLVSEAEDEAPPANALCRLWKYDTGNALDAYAWKFHLRRCGFYPNAEDQLDPETVRVIVASGASVDLRTRKACLWLVSNIPHLRQTPLRIPLHSGIPFANANYPDAQGQKTAFPLIGIRAFHRAGLTIQIDMANLTLSIWAPGSWLRSAGRFLRRLPDRFSRLSLESLRDDDWA
jgi:hypothetical protein